MIAKQVIVDFLLILISQDRKFQMDSIHLFEQGLIGKSNQTYPFMLSAKQGIIWYHFYDVLGMTQSKIKPRTSPSQGELYH